MCDEERSLSSCRNCEHYKKEDARAVLWLMKPLGRECVVGDDFRKGVIRRHIEEIRPYLTVDAEKLKISDQMIGKYCPEYKRQAYPNIDSKSLLGYLILVLGLSESAEKEIETCPRRPRFERIIEGVIDSFLKDDARNISDAIVIPGGGGAVKIVLEKQDDGLKAISVGTTPPTAPSEFFITAQLLSDNGFSEFSD
ncbi:MAG: hypothetical protein WBA17_09075 [Saprospiraceae bacterium]